MQERCGYAQSSASQALKRLAILQEAGNDVARLWKPVGRRGPGGMGTSIGKNDEGGEAT